MKTVHYESFVSRIARRTMRFALRVSSMLATLIGIFLLLIPMMVVDPDSSVFIQKLINVMGGAEVLIVLAFVSLALGTWLRGKLLKLRQAENDSIAQKIMSELQADSTVPVPEYYLYLRAFETTGKLRVPLYLKVRKISPNYALQLNTNDMESYVSNAVRGIAPLIALGRPGEIIGAGRIATEDANWMADILVLMKRAKAILLVPSNRSGTLWEIETLKREGLLNRVIFLMPPRTKGKHDTKERWEAARQVLASYGLEAPEHQEQGLLFKVGTDGKVSNVEPLLLNSLRQVRKSMKRIMSDDPPKGGLFKAIAVADRRIGRATFWGWVNNLYIFLPYALAVQAIGVEPPAVGFNPSESWGVVWDRSLTTSRISKYKTSENIILTMSEKYRAIEARTSQEKLAELRQALIVRGLIRLDDNMLRYLFTSLSDMLARVDTKTCAAIARGEIQSDAIEIAYTYIPMQDIDGFLAARTASILAAAEDAPVHSLDLEAVTQAKKLFQANLGTEGQLRYERINQGQGRLSDDDQCWLIRVLYRGVALLVEPHSSVWARNLITTEIPTDVSTGPGQAPENATHQ